MSFKPTSITTTNDKTTDKTTSSSFTLNYVPQDPYASMIKSNINFLSTGFGIMPTVFNDLGVLPTLYDNAKQKTLGEVYKEIADAPVTPVPLVYVNETPQYNQLKNDDDIKKSVTKYYYYKMLEKWMFHDMTGILAFVKFNESGNPTFIVNDSEFDIPKTTNESKQNLQTRIDFIKNIFFTKDFVKKILKKIIKKNNISWYDLYDHEPTVKKALYINTVEYLKKNVKM